MKEAPLFVQSYDLLSWLLDRLEQAASFPFLSEKVLHASSDLTQAIALALQGFDTHEHATEADVAAARLRLFLRLVFDKELLSLDQYHFAIGELEEIGRQLGGWLKKLDSVS